MSPYHIVWQQRPKGDGYTDTNMAGQGDVLYTDRDLTQEIANLAHRDVVHTVREEP